MKARALILRLLVLLAGVSSLQAAPDPAGAPLAARDYLEAVRARGFAAQADFLHPQELQRFRDRLLGVLESEEAAGNRALLYATFGRDASLLQARLAEPKELAARFARVMAVRMPDQPVGFDSLEVLGTVEEGDTAHVLVRTLTESGEQTLEDLRIVSLRPHRDSWKVLMSPQLVQAISSMDPDPGGKRPTPRLVPTPADPGGS